MPSAIVRPPCGSTERTDATCYSREIRDADRGHGVTAFRMRRFGQRRDAGSCCCGSGTGTTARLALLERSLSESPCPEAALKTVVLPDCGNPIMPIFIFLNLAG